MDCILIDGRNLAFRAHYTRQYLSSHGRCTSVISGFPEMLISISRKWPNASFIIAWDGKGKTWRHEVMAARSKRLRVGEAIVDTNASEKRIERDQSRTYKGNRDKKNEIRKMVEAQIPILKGFLMNMGILNFEVGHFEADDLIGVLSHYLPKRCEVENVIVYSCDRDYYQLISKKVIMWHPKGGERTPTLLSAEKIKSYYKVGVEDWAKYKALMGDHGDNISNVKYGIGPVRARQLLEIGLDASQEKFEHLSKEARDNPKLLEFRDSWREVHDNFRLCKIIKRISDKNLNEDVRANISKIIKICETRGLERSKRGKSDEAYKATLDLMGEYELSTLYGLRQELWAIP